MKIHKIISDRWSPVAFSDETLSDKQIMSLFEAARWAPSSYNAQPWRFIYGKKGENTYDALFNLLSEGNKAWAGTAPLLVLGMAETIFPTRNTSNRFALYDTGMAVGNLLAQATSMGLLVHQMGGYDANKARDVFTLPESWEALAIMAIGYKGNPDQLAPEIAEREQKTRERSGVDTFVFRAGL
jgi:nitroreductase